MGMIVNGVDTRDEEGFKDREKVNYKAKARMSFRLNLAEAFHE